MTSDPQPTSEELKALADRLESNPLYADYESRQAAHHLRAYAEQMGELRKTKADAEAYRQAANKWKLDLAQRDARIKELEVACASKGDAIDKARSVALYDPPPGVYRNFFDEAATEHEALKSERDSAVKEANRRDQKWMDGINEIIGRKLDYGDPSAPNAASTALESWKAEHEAWRKALEFYSDYKRWIQCEANGRVCEEIDDGDPMMVFKDGEDHPWSIASEALKGSREWSRPESDILFSLKTAQGLIGGAIRCVEENGLVKGTGVPPVETT